MSRTILAIDPGTQCGWAVRAPDGSYVSGVWDLAVKRHESPGMRFIRLRAHLNDLARAYGSFLVAYEEVRNHKGVSAAHIYGGIIATVQAWCAEAKMEHVGIPVGTVKKRATGKGNANKDAMVRAAHQKWLPNVAVGSALTMDDNEADARWIAETAWGEYGGATDAA